MKQLFRCEYCTEVGTEEEIVKHEQECIYNYNRRSCFTCAHKKGNYLAITCDLGRELESGKYMEGCSKYEWDEKNHTGKNAFGGNLFGGLF